MRAVEYLDPEIANEGLRADLPVEGSWSPGGDFQPFIDPPVIPDYAFVKQKGMEHLRRLFPQHSGIAYVHQAFPVWAYHKTEAPRLLRTEQHATEHGMRFIKKTRTFQCDGEWSDEPHSDPKFDVNNLGMGKNYLNKNDPNANQASMIAAVVAAVTAQMSGGANALASPKATDPDYAEFLAFKAWKDGAKPKAEVKLSPAEEKAALIKIAEDNGVKVDKRWSIDNLKDELDKIAK